MRGKKPQPLNIARKKWARHKAQSKYIGVEFNFAFDEWYQWWLDHGVDKNVNVIWDGKQRACMCRRDANLGYQPNNVYFGTNSENVRHLHTSGNYDPTKKSNARKYRWGDRIVTFNELVALRGPTKDSEKDHFDARFYDWANQHETKRLVNRYNNYIKCYKKFWETPNGVFETLEEAADSVGLSKTKLLDMFQRKKYNKMFKKYKILNCLGLDDYIKQNSRYPDPYYFKK